MLASSGFIPTVEGFELGPLASATPIVLGHETYEPVIGVEWSPRAHKLLPHVVYRESPLPHTIDPRFRRELGPWLYDIAEQTPSENARRNA